MNREDQQGRRSGIDRRSGEDRRKCYSLDYFSTGGVERRVHNSDRRAGGPDRRHNWIRVSPWSSEPGDYILAALSLFAPLPF
jgi:hypothetical protein